MTIAPEDKRCSRCREIKKRTDFYKNKAAKDGLQYRCKACTKVVMAHQDVVNRTTRLETKRASMRNNRLKVYGITSLEWQQMVVAQGGKCAGCLRVAELQVDHCHAGTGVRGLLCGECNRTLGLVRDDVATLLRLVEYLQAHEARSGGRSGAVVGGGLRLVPGGGAGGADGGAAEHEHERAESVAVGQ